METVKPCQRTSDPAPVHEVKDEGYQRSSTSTSPRISRTMRWSHKQGRRQAEYTSLLTYQAGALLI